MGAKTITEITEFVPKYLNANEVDEIEDVPTTTGTPSEVVLPEMDGDIPILAADYAVVDGTIVSRKDYVQIEDAPVAALNLSVRSNNCLEKSGLTRISCLVGLPYEQFRRIRNLGALSANEIQEKLEIYLSRCHSEAGAGTLTGAIYSTSDVLRVFKEYEYESLSITEICEALADAGVECGLPRAKALEYASQTLLGSAELLLSSGKHPAVLKDEVCSPGGTTIAGVHALEENGFRGAAMNAVKAAFDKTKQLG
jgi:hypothetical protein